MESKNQKCNFSSYNKIYLLLTKFYPHDSCPLFSEWGQFQNVGVSCSSLQNIVLSVMEMFNFAAVIMSSWGFPGACPPVPWCIFLSRPPCSLLQLWSLSPGCPSNNSANKSPHANPTPTSGQMLSMMWSLTISPASFLSCVFQPSWRTMHRALNSCVFLHICTCCFFCFFFFVLFFNKKMKFLFVAHMEFWRQWCDHGSLQP